MKGIFFSSITDEEKSIEENYHEYIGTYQDMIIERPIGFKHVTGVIYKLNYGYIPNTIGKDGDEIDVYLLDMPTPLKVGDCIRVKIIAAIIRYDNCDDIETKYVAVLDDMNVYERKDIKQLTDFMEYRFKTIIVD